MNTKPINHWEYEELMRECAWIVIEAITKGEPLLRAMYQVDGQIMAWRKEKNLCE